MAAPRVVGGFKAEEDPNEEVNAMATALKADIEEAAGSKYEEFTVVKYTTQVVAGTNYKVKIKVGDSAYIHATIFKPLPHTQTGPSVSKVDTGKSEADAL